MTVHSLKSELKHCEAFGVPYAAFINPEGRRGRRWRPTRPNNEFLY
jgi:hypothetical protein